MPCSVRRWLTAGAVIAMLTGTPAAALSQVQTVTLYGTVTDATGGVMPGVTVTLTSPQLIRGAEVKVTDALGEWRVGDPLDPVNRIGPLVSDEHFRKVRSFLGNGEKVLHGGEITVSSVVGRGSEFTIRLPREVAADVDEAMEKVNETSPQAGAARNPGPIA